MDRDTFIITVYCLVVEHFDALASLFTLRCGGFQPALTDQEVITMEICGEFFKLHKDRDLFAYFHLHYLHFFPNLTDRTRFVRQTADLWQVKAAIEKRLVEVSEQSQTSIQPLIPCPYRFVLTHEPSAINASNSKPIMDIVRPSTCLTTASNWA